MMRSFGVSANDMPHPEADGKGFMKHIMQLNKKEKAVYDPITKKMEPWLRDGHDLAKLLHVGGCCIM